MAFLLETPLSKSCWESSEMAAWQWLYASLSKQLEDLQALLGVAKPCALYGSRAFDPAYDALCWPSLDEEAAEPAALRS